MSDDTKKCPYCAETIKAEAIRCRYCGHDLAAAGSAPPRPPSYPPGSSPAPRPYAGSPYPPPGYYAQTARTNGFAIASLVLGIVWIYGIGSILALVFGYKAKREIDRSNGGQTGRGMAIAGIVLGWVGVAGVVLVIIGIAVAATHSASYGP